MAEEVILAMKRKEIKYLLKKEDMEGFKTDLGEFMRLDKYGLTTILSLYYDTRDYRLINASMEKPEFKEKIRLRSYGLAKEDAPLFLELKRKASGIVYKRRIVLNQKDVDVFLQGGPLNFPKGQLAKEITYFRDFYGELEPKFLILYDRMAYYQENSNLRLTIDANPRYRNKDLNLHSSTEGISLLEEGEAIVEIKIQDSMPLWLAHLLDKYHLKKISFSKVGEAFKKQTNRALALEGRKYQWKQYSNQYLVTA